MRALIAAIFIAFSAHAAEVPSGQSVTLHEVLVDETAPGTWLRFRFVAPQIARDGGDQNYETSAPDMVHLCDALALPYIAEYALQGEVIVISFSDRITKFGKADPTATQFFEAFRVENDACIWGDL